MRAAALALAISSVALSSMAVAVASPGLAQADVTHVVQRGHTIESIAHRYHVSEHAIIEANHLKDAKHLKPGQTLIIPGVEGKGKGGKDREKAERAEREHERDHTATRPDRPDRAERADKGEKGDKGHGPARAATAALEPPPEPRGRGDGDTVHAARLGEEFRVRVKDGHGHIPPTALKAFERMMRQGNATHAIDPRLVALVSIVSSHFGGKPLEIVSGYRAYTPTQYTPHSNHNLGKALDFRVRGVPNEAVRDFCRTLRSAGCGYYPNSYFVHLDVRDAKAYWIDYSHPGEPPRYDKAGVAADEGASDVPDDSPPSVSASPPAASPPPADSPPAALQPLPAP
jgi:uncharacterized protein YcbK (DUF882 family)/LysM repeat protein